MRERRPGLALVASFRPPVGLDVAETVIRAALEDDGLELVPHAQDRRPCRLYGVLADGALVVRVAASAVRPRLEP